MRLCLLLLLLGSTHRVSTQLPEPIQEEAGSGVTTGTPSPPQPVDDTYWAGTAPLCMGGCRGRHQELRRDLCGDSDCCWVGYKSLCRVNCGRPDVDFNGVVYGDDWWVGSVVRHACRSGFLLVGDPARTCRPDGLWTPGPSCLRVCRRGRIEVSERDIDGSCSSSCPSKSYEGPPKQGCIRIDNCRKSGPDWPGWFSRCDSCQCDCSVPCGSAG